MTEPNVPNSPWPGPSQIATIFHQQQTRSRKLLLEFLAGIPTEVFIRPVEALNGESLRDKLFHMIETERWWVSVVKREPYQEPAGPREDLGALVSIWAETTGTTQAFLQGADPDWFGREESYRLGSRPDVIPLIPSMVMLHVLTHEFHHKGQICMGARMAGFVPPDLDYF